MSVIGKKRGIVVEICNYYSKIHITIIKGRDAMMLQCRFDPDYSVPISFNIKEDFCQPPDQNGLQIIHVESGCAALRINNDRCFIQSGVLIFRNPGVVIEKLYSNNLIAQSISFKPDLINYQRPNHTCKDNKNTGYIYPYYHLFYDLSYSYSGILTLDPMVRPKAKDLFSSAISQMTDQPDSHWCSRVRVILIELYRLARNEYSFHDNSESKTTLAHNTLDYIHGNYEKVITVAKLCERFHTNHTTLLKEFRALTGTTINQYILEYRLNLVREALLFTSLTIDEIAIKFGFRQASYLSRVFRARTGMAPGCFRNQLINQISDLSDNKVTKT